MKKALSLILVLLLVFTLFACNNQPAETSESPDESSMAPTSSEPTDSGEPGESQSPDTMTDPSVNEDEIGFFYALDPASRDTYDIVFAYPRPMQLMQNITSVLEELSSKLNYNISTTTGDNDIDLYIQNLEILATQGTDGFINVIDPTSSVRIIEVLDELGIPYIGLLNTVKDDDGHALVPMVALDGFAAGETQVQWMYDNYTNYWGDIDASKVAMIATTFSPNSDFQDRHDGAVAKFEELFPGNQVFTADGIVGTLNTETGYDMIAPIFTANSDIEHWFVISCLEQYAQGAARAAENLGIEDSVLVSCVGSDILSSEWNNGYEGCWVTCLAVSDYLYTVPTICGLVSLIDGTSTQESLWAQKRASGDQYTIYYIGNEMVTKDTYQDYFDRIAATLEAE